MPLPLALLKTLSSAAATDVWQAIFSAAWEVCSPPLPPVSVEGEVTRRDRDLADIDNFLASAGWELWATFEQSVDQTADALARWWEARSGGRAVLILDGLSLREVPWLLQSAKARGYRIAESRATGSELPGETNAFARALGYAQRSSLANNGSGKADGSTRLPGARTECLEIAWEDCARLVGSEPRWVLWHHWPDRSIHDMAVAGQGLASLATDAAAQLTSDGFWRLVERLTNGRRLVITSDHGYAASGLFADAPEAQAKHLKGLFAGGRFASTKDSSLPDGPWVPPLDLTLDSRHGRYRYALGRRKWKSPAGYPTLAHGGLSVLEVASPFLELSRGE
jgi:hypothetical protein